MNTRKLYKEMRERDIVQGKAKKKKKRKGERRRRSEAKMKGWTDTRVWLKSFISFQRGVHTPRVKTRSHIITVENRSDY